MTTTSNPRVEAIRQNVRSSYETLQQLIEDRVAHIDPELLYQLPAPGEWSIMENLAHIVEFMPYWADEIARLVAQPGQNFGRTKEDPNRILAIEQHSHDALDQVRIALPNSYTRLDEVLSTLKDSDLELTGYHSKFKEQTLNWFMKDFVTDHLRNHVEQINQALSAVGAR